MYRYTLAATRATRAPATIAVLTPEPWFGLGTEYICAGSLTEISSHVILSTIIDGPARSCRFNDLGEKAADSRQFERLAGSRDHHIQPVFAADQVRQRLLLLCLTVDQKYLAQVGRLRLQPRQQFPLVGVAAEFVETGDFGAHAHWLAKNVHLLP